MNDEISDPEDSDENNQNARDEYDDQNDDNEDGMFMDIDEGNNDQHSSIDDVPQMPISHNKPKFS